ncbi:hypothetical protein ANN_28079 [Periplaneta americana]|uniref:Uncharacterized protein n=1 Tax=Periplaneta americana TaxID=6978 RepID=A0ABQ8RUW9_PERAM|nr:hypothetical protein ANN_28079 [Periplaneta americana]
MYKLKEEVLAFFTIEGLEYADLFADDERVSNLAYLLDIFVHLNELNIEMQGSENRLRKPAVMVGGIIVVTTRYFISGEQMLGNFRQNLSEKNFIVSLIFPDVIEERPNSCMGIVKEDSVRVVMDVIKMEPALDLLYLQLHDNTYEMEGNDPLSEERNLSHLDVTGMKTECMDQSYDIKSEIKVEDITPMPISFPVVKTEVDKELLDVGRVRLEQKVEVSSEEDEVLTESFVDHDEKRVIRERTGIDREEDNLTECGSNRQDCSNLSDVNRNYIKCKAKGNSNAIYVESVSHNVGVYADMYAFTQAKSRSNARPAQFEMLANKETNARDAIKLCDKQP